MSNAMISCLLIALLTTNLGAADGLLSLHATAPESMVKSGVGIVVRLTITNKTNYNVTYYDKRRDCDYLLTVQTSSGAPASDTPYALQGFFELSPILFKSSAAGAGQAE